MRRAIGRVIPGEPVTLKLLATARTFRGHQGLESRNPVVVVGVAQVGVTAGLRQADLARKRVGPDGARLVTRVGVLRRLRPLVVCVQPSCSFIEIDATEILTRSE